MRKVVFRRLFFASVVAIVPLSTACELAFDFDRTPLQPVYEGGAADDASDASTDRHAGDATRDS